MKQCLRIIISGEVYKTGYRYFLKQKATGLNISGYVRYTENHDVEVLTAGEKDDLNLFILYCRRGNQGSRVSSNNIQECIDTTNTSFEVLDDSGINQHIKLYKQL